MPRQTKLNRRLTPGGRHAQRHLFVSDPKLERHRVATDAFLADLSRVPI